MIIKLLQKIYERDKKIHDCKCEINRLSAIINSLTKENTEKEILLEYYKAENFRKDDLAKGAKDVLPK